MVGIVAVRGIFLAVKLPGRDLGLIPLGPRGAVLQSRVKDYRRKQQRPDDGNDSPTCSTKIHLTLLCRRLRPRPYWNRNGPSPI